MRRANFILIGLAAGGLAFSAGAVTVADLQKQLAGGEKITIVDLRDTKLFVESHIPGAINIPASLCPYKKLPALGKLVVYDDGLGRKGAAELKAAAAALAAKPGISVDTLEGGYAAWESSEAMTTHGKGMHREVFNYISYQQLQAVSADDVVLIDMRKLTKPVTKLSATLSDLNQEFPGKRVASAAPEKAGGPLLVLIDSADGTAEAMARRLKAGGNRRCVILEGGELAILRKGRPGLERSAPRTSVAGQNPNTPPTGSTGQ